MECQRTSPLPEDLQPDNYAYPPALLEDRIKIMRFDGGDDIRIPVPLSEDERTLIMAKFAVCKTIYQQFGLRHDEQKLTTIARRENGGLQHALQKAWSTRHKSYDGLYKGDIELAADELGVYEIIWPFDPAKMLEAIAAEA